MEDVNVVLCGIGPHVELDDSDPSLERPDDGNVAAIAAELVAGEVRVVARVDEVVGERLRHVVADLRLRQRRVQVGGEEEAVEVIERQQRARQARDARAAAAPLVPDLIEQAVHAGVFQRALAVARGLEVAAEAIGAHVRAPAGVVREDGADVVRRGRVTGVETALEDEAALVRRAHLFAFSLSRRAGVKLQLQLQQQRGEEEEAARRGVG